MNRKKYMNVKSKFTMLQNLSNDHMNLCLFSQKFLEQCIENQKISTAPAA